MYGHTLISCTYTTLYGHTILPRMLLSMDMYGHIPHLFMDTCFTLYGHMTHYHKYVSSQPALFCMDTVYYYLLKHMYMDSLSFFVLTQHYCVLTHHVTPFVT